MPSPQGLRLSTQQRQDVTRSESPAFSSTLNTPFPTPRRCRGFIPNGQSFSRCRKSSPPGLDRPDGSRLPAGDQTVPRLAARTVRRHACQLFAPGGDATGSDGTCSLRSPKVDGRKVTFRAHAHDGHDLISDGTHQRVVIDAARFNQKLQSKRAAVREFRRQTVYPSPDFAPRRPPSLRPAFRFATWMPKTGWCEGCQPDHRRNSGWSHMGDDEKNAVWAQLELRRSAE